MSKKKQTSEQAETGNATLSSIKLSAFDHYESVAEELKMNGFEVRVIKGGNGFGWLIEYDTIAGRIKYSCSENTVMADYYRFISHFGGRLSKWGLDNKLETHKH
jgi:hypothetical protein